MQEITPALWLNFEAIEKLCKSNSLDFSSAQDEALSVVLSEITADPDLPLLIRRFRSLSRNRMRKLYQRRLLTENSVASDRRHNGEPIPMTASHADALVRASHLETLSEVEKLIGNLGMEDFRDIAAGYSYEQIALRSGTTLAATKARIHRNRAACRNSFGHAEMSKAA